MCGGKTGSGAGHEIKNILKKDGGLAGKKSLRTNGRPVLGIS